MAVGRYMITVSSKNTEVFRGEYEFDYDDQQARQSAVNDALNRSGYGEPISPEDEVTTNVLALPG